MRNGSQGKQRNKAVREMIKWERDGNFYNVKQVKVPSSFLTRGNRRGRDRHGHV